MPKFTRRRLLAGAAPLVAAPVLGKLAFDGDAEAAQRTLQGHVMNQPAMGHAAMIGEDAPAVGGPRDLDALLYPPPALPYEPGRVREYALRAIDREIEIAPGVFFPAWTYNGTVPGPVLRATEGDTLRVKLTNAGSHPHTIHFHGIHPANMDGVFEIVPPGAEFTYEFEARRAGFHPYHCGFHPYHCHVSPLKKHIHSTPTSRSSPSSAGWDSSTWSTDGGQGGTQGASSPGARGRSSRFSCSPSPSAATSRAERRSRT